jgi:uncharacterized protein (DUF697 family)
VSTVLHGRERAGQEVSPAVDFGLDLGILLTGAWLAFWFVNVPKPSDLARLTEVWATWTPAAGVAIAAAAAAVAALAMKSSGVRGFVPVSLRYALIGGVVVGTLATGYHVAALQPLAAKVREYADQAAESDRKLKEKDTKARDDYQKAYKEAWAKADEAGKQNLEKMNQTFKEHQDRVSKEADAREADRKREQKEMLETLGNMIAKGEAGIQAVKEELTRKIEDEKNKQTAPEPSPDPNVIKPLLTPIAAAPEPTEPEEPDEPNGVESAIKLAIAAAVLAFAPALAPILDALGITFGVNEEDGRTVVDAVRTTFRSGAFNPADFKAALANLDRGGQASPLAVFRMYGAMLQKLKEKSPSPEVDDAVKALEERMSLLQDPLMARIFRRLGFQDTTELVEFFGSNADKSEAELGEAARQFLLRKKEINPETLRGVLRLYLREKLQKPEAFIQQFEQKLNG